MNLLEKIISDKKREVSLKKSIIPISQLEKSLLFSSKTYSLGKMLLKSNNGIIAEHKRRSPSKSEINHGLSVQDVVLGYENAGVCGISVLTDGKYFGGSLDDFILARASVNIPLLRKDFTIDAYQIMEAKAHGADVVLLIAAVLSRHEIKELSELSHRLGMEVLCEVHNEEELEKAIMPGIDFIGVNNRNLKTFEVNIENSIKLSDKIPKEFLKVSESGLDNAAAIKELRNYGFQGFLMGEHFMKTENPGNSAQKFIHILNSKI
jgi:indole-3-glycerol phosphate synthase